VGGLNLRSKDLKTDFSTANRVLFTAASVINLKEARNVLQNAGARLNEWPLDGKGCGLPGLAFLSSEVSLFNRLKSQETKCWY